MSIKAKQVAGVTSLVVLIVAVLSGYHLATLARLNLQETASRAELLSKAIFQRAEQVVATPSPNPYAALQKDGGIRAILESSIGYSKNVTYAAIVDPKGIAVAHSTFPSQEGHVLPKQEDFAPIVAAGALTQLSAVYSDRTFEIEEPIFASNDQVFATIRIGVSPLLVRSELQGALRTAAGTVVAILAISMLVAMLLAQWMLRPIHVIQSAFSRLGRGELDVRLELPEVEFKDLGSSFEAVSAQLAALGRAGSSDPAEPHTVRPGGSADFESVMENLEDAVALFSPTGDIIFSNAGMRALRITELPPSHPAKQLVDRTLAGRKSQGPIAATFTDASARVSNDPRIPDGGAHENVEAERMLMSHAIEDTSGRFLGAMLVARNLGYLTQVHSTLNYSRKLAALGRLMTGVAHEVKNPLNAMTIHLELLKQKLAAVPELVTVAAGGGDHGPRSTDLSKHVHIISSEIRRLDEVVNGFLKFARPDELKLQPVQLGALVSEVVTTAMPEADARNVTIRAECPSSVPAINADPGMLSQALLNLAINACQAMPNGGTLRISCRTEDRRRVIVDIEDTGVGIPPEHLSRIFDLYFTTKKDGSGIGLSMVYRIVQLHDGEVEVQSTPGHGTRFRLMFPQPSRPVGE